MQQQSEKKTSVKLYVKSRLKAGEWHEQMHLNKDTCENNAGKLKDQEGHCISSGNAYKLLFNA